jgi:hypothetical protein
MLSSAPAALPRSAGAAVLRDDHNQRMAVVRDVGEATVRIWWTIQPNCGVGNAQLTVGRGNF